MDNEHQIVKAVLEAKESSQKADELIKAYIPFIRTEAGKFSNRICTDTDDEYSIAMIAFYEAIMGYDKERGAFLKYAALLIRSRLIDYSRKEARHEGHLSLEEERDGEDERTLKDTLPDKRDYYEESENRKATREEIAELSKVLSGFGLAFSDIADNCPKQERTKLTCIKAIQKGGKDKELLKELLRTKKLPMAQLVSLSGMERKTLERHRKYILAMLLIQTNGYEIIRNHLFAVLKKGESTI